MVETERQNILKIVRRLLETRLETSMKKEADKIRKYGKKNRRIGNYREIDYNRKKPGRLE